MSEDVKKNENVQVKDNENKKSVEKKETKKLNLTQIKNKNKQYEKKEKIQLDEEFHVHIYPNFSPTKIQALLEDYYADRMIAESEQLGLDVIDKSEWLYMNVFKHFTDLQIPDEYTKKIEAYIALIDSGYLYPLIYSFPVESTDQILIAMEALTEKLNSVQDMEEGEREEFMNMLSKNSSNREQRRELEKRMGKKSGKKSKTIH